MKRFRLRPEKPTARAREGDAPVERESACFHQASSNYDDTRLSNVDAFYSARYRDNPEDCSDRSRSDCFFDGLVISARQDPWRVLQGTK